MYYKWVKIWNVLQVSENPMKSFELRKDMISFMMLKKWLSCEDNKFGDMENQYLHEVM